MKLFYAAPHKNNLYWYVDRSEKFFLEMAGTADADILVYGHTHKPYKKELNGRTFINAGSVGKPKDGDPLARLTVLEMTPDDVAADFIRLPYDVLRSPFSSCVTKAGPSLFEHHAAPFILPVAVSCRSPAQEKAGKKKKKMATEYDGYLYQAFVTCRLRKCYVFMNCFSGNFCMLICEL